MSNTRTAENPSADQVHKYASAASIAGPRLPQTIVARATALRDPETRDTLRSVASFAISENIALEKISREIDIPVEDVRRAVCDPDFEIPDEVLTSLTKFVARKVREVEDEPFVETRVSKIIEDVLEQAAYERLLAIILGEYRTGKSYDAKRWAKMNLHRAVYVEVPSGSDKNIFMRTLGQELGIGVSSTYKTSQIEWKIRQACAEWKPVLILDEGHRLWNEEIRSTPQRIEFVRDLVSPKIGASVVIVATNQFSNAQERAERGSQNWGSGQWVGRIGRIEELPKKLSEAELLKVVRAHIPDVGEKALQGVYSFANSSDGYLGSVENVAKMARHIARREGRKEPTSANIFDAIRALIPTSRVLRKQFVKKDQHV